MPKTGTTTPNCCDWVIGFPAGSNVVPVVTVVGTVASASAEFSVKSVESPTPIPSPELVFVGGAVVVGSPVAFVGRVFWSAGSFAWRYAEYVSQSPVVRKALYAAAYAGLSSEFHATGVVVVPPVCWVVGVFDSGLRGLTLGRWRASSDSTDGRNLNFMCCSGMGTVPRPGASAPEPVPRSQ